MNNRKVVYIISDLDRAIAFEWIGKNLNPVFELYFILLGRQQTKLSKALSETGCRVIEIKLTNTISMVPAFFKVLLALIHIKPEVVHTHLFRANLIGLTAGRILNIPKRIFTRHHAMVHYHEYPKGLKWDKYINRIATHIVAISQNTRDILVLLDMADERKIRVIKHGFDLNYFRNIDEIKIETLRKKYWVYGRYPVVGVISRYLHWKGVHDVIRSFKSLIDFYPNTLLILSNANGIYKSEIQKVLESLPKDSFIEIEFENDLASLYKLFDVFVHVPIDLQSEAFGQTYVEALASGIPSVFTLSGVAPEFIRHEENALVVPFCDSESIYQAMLRILSDHELRNRLIANGKESANQFPLSKMLDQLKQVYES